MTPREERNQALGWAIVFFLLACMFAVLTYNSFSNGALKLGAAMIVLTLLMAGACAFCARHFLICRHAEREMKKGKEETNQ